MTPSDRHDELVALLTEIRDALDPQHFVKVSQPDFSRVNESIRRTFAKAMQQPRPEPVRASERCASRGEPEPEWQHECSDVTEEPQEAESRVVDVSGDVWWKTYAGCWHRDSEGDAECSTWAQLRNGYAPLRPTTDADRKRVGLPDEPAPADVDPDEARVCYSDECGEPCQSKQERDRDEIARLGTQIGLLSYRLGDERKSRKKAEVERDEWRERYVELSERMDEAAQDFRITAAERDEWQARHAALRADVEDARRNPETLTRLLMRIADALDRDDEWGA